jgi:hypothetical protein
MKKKYFAPSVCTIVMEEGTLLAGSGVYDGRTIVDEKTTSEDDITYGEAKQSGGLWDDEE